MSMCLLISASARVATQAVPFFDGASSRGQKACIKSYQPTRNQHPRGQWTRKLERTHGWVCQCALHAEVTRRMHMQQPRLPCHSRVERGKGVWPWLCLRISPRLTAPPSFPVEVPTSGSQKQGGHPSRRPPTERPPRQALGRGPPGGRTVGPRWAVGRGAAGPALFQPRASLGWRSWRRRGRRTRRRRRRRR
ncbi:unnamed protein product, partial [Prorocentrum cordatum]